jgi:hypothetical protein
MVTNRQPAIYPRLIVDDLRGKHDGIPGAPHLVAHAELSLIATVAAEGLEGGVLLEDDHEGPGLLDSSAVLEEVHRQYGPY